MLETIEITSLEEGRQYIDHQRENWDPDLKLLVELFPIKIEAHGKVEPFSGKVTWHSPEHDGSPDVGFTVE